jgi:hypothetical protein
LRPVALKSFSGPPRLTIQNNMPTMGSKRYLADALDSVNTEYSVTSLKLVFIQATRFVGFSYNVTSCGTESTVV